MTAPSNPSYFRADVHAALESIAVAITLLQQAVEVFETNPPHPILDVRLHERALTSIAILGRLQKGLRNALAAVSQGDSP